MNGLARISRISLTAAKRTTINKSFYSGSARVCGGAKPGHDDHGHDDHEHHDHPVRLYLSILIYFLSALFVLYKLNSLWELIDVGELAFQQARHGIPSFRPQHRRCWTCYDGLLSPAEEARIFYLIEIGRL